MNPSRHKWYVPLILSFTILLSSARADVPSAPKKFQKPFTPKEFKDHLIGPIFSLPMPFAADGNVDHDSIKKMIGVALEYDIKIFEMSSGNSMYDWLSYDEMKAATRTLVRAVGDRGLTITCMDDFWTDRAIDYVRYAEKIGADAVEVHAPDISEDAMVKYFQRIADSTRMAISFSNKGLAPETIRRLLEIESVVAMKEHSLQEYIFLQTRFGDRLRIYGGGTTYRFLTAAPYGAKAYFDIYAIFAPWVAKDFWEAYQKGNTEKCYEMVKTYDVPICEAFDLGFFHAALEYFRVGQRHLRDPLKGYTDEQMKEVQEFFQARGLFPRE